MAISLIDAKNIVGITVTEIQGQKQLKVRIKARLFESSYSVDKIETEVVANTIIIKAYKKYVMFVPREKRTDEIGLEIIIPDFVNEIRFHGDDKAIWLRKKND